MCDECRDSDAHIISVLNVLHKSRLVGLVVMCAFVSILLRL